jgi:hypothetical protein
MSFIFHFDNLHTNPFSFSLFMYNNDNNNSVVNQWR